MRLALELQRFPRFHFHTSTINCSVIESLPSSLLSQRCRSLRADQLARLQLQPGAIRRHRQTMHPQQRTSGSTAIQRSYTRASQGSKERKYCNAVRMVNASPVLTPQLASTPNKPSNTVPKPQKAHSTKTSDDQQVPKSLGAPTPRKLEKHI